MPKQAKNNPFRHKTLQKINKNVKADVAASGRFQGNFGFIMPLIKNNKHENFGTISLRNIRLVI